jgi:hypothetical protein
VLKETYGFVNLLHWPRYEKCEIAALLSHAIGFLEHAAEEASEIAGDFPSTVICNDFEPYRLNVVTKSQICPSSCL